MASENQVSSGAAAALHGRTRMKRLKPGKPLVHGGPVAEKVRDLLVDPKLSYDRIAEQVQAEVDGAKTTARSVASIVRGLRREGFRVPPRKH